MIYNNLFVHTGGNATNGLDPIVAVKATDGIKLSMKVYNNTIVDGNCAAGLVNLIRCDTFYFKNNLLVLDSTSTSRYMVQSPLSDLSSYDAVDIDYNHYYDSDGDYRFGTSTTANWSQWQASGYDTHGSIGPVNFINEWDTTAYSHNLLPGSPGIDQGITLAALFGDDIQGNQRPQGSSWDIGALEKVQGGGGNNPPVQPSNPQPLNAAVDQSIDVNVSWSCTDPENDPLTYDVYFGTSSNPAQVSNNQPGTAYEPGQLANSTTYYWKIVAQDDHGNSTTGAVWHFTTAAGFVNTPPAQPSNPNPVNAAENQDTIITVSWNCSDPDGDTLTYDVYFGTNNNPPLVSANQSAKNYNPGTLTTGTTYYWKVIAKDNHNASTAGPEWHFTTVSQGTNTFATIELKVFLEGPYTDNAMDTQLEENSLIPKTQPYNQSPWAYGGNEEVSQVPANTVDWVLLELRSTTTNVVARQAVLLRNDGRVTDLDGSERVNFPNVPGGQYYVVVYHRNHLAIMSKNPLQLSDSTAFYDFTTSQDKAYGSGAMKDLGNGRFALYAADGNGNGNVNNADNNSVWKKENGSIGYEQGDYDMNGGVTIVDKNSKWKPNNGKSTQVP